MVWNWDLVANLADEQFKFTFDLAIAHYRRKQCIRWIKAWRQIPREPITDTMEIWPVGMSYCEVQPPERVLAHAPSWYDHPDLSPDTHAPKNRHTYRWCVWLSMSIWKMLPLHLKYTAPLPGGLPILASPYPFLIIQIHWSSYSHHALLLRTLFLLPLEGRFSSFHLSWWYFFLLGVFHILIYVVCINHVFYKHPIDGSKHTNSLYPSKHERYTEAKPSEKSWVNRSLALGL